MDNMISVLIGLAGSIVIAGLAYARRSLSKSGFVAAVVLGTMLYVLGNVIWYGCLIAFFISSTLLSKIRHPDKQRAEQYYEKGGRRDASQVMANGGLPLLAAVGYVIWPHPDWWYACLGALAAVNADTWATELGTLSRGKPWSIRNWRRVERGTSGGVSVVGLIASIAGGCFIGGCAWVLSTVSDMGPELSETGLILPRTASGGAGLAEGLHWVLTGGGAGLVASLFDSWLGAYAQALFRCPVCGRTTEKDEHCGVASEHVSGWRLLRNDQVNAAAGICGAIVAVLLANL